MSQFPIILGAGAALLVMLLMGACIYVAWLRHGAPADDDGGEA